MSSSRRQQLSAAVAEHVVNDSPQTLDSLCEILDGVWQAQDAIGRYFQDHGPLTIGTVLVYRLDGVGDPSVPSVAFTASSELDGDDRRNVVGGQSLQDYINDLCADPQLDAGENGRLSDYVMRYGASTLSKRTTLCGLFPDTPVYAATATDDTLEQQHFIVPSVYPRDVRQHPHLLPPRLILQLSKYTYVLYRVPGLSWREIMDFHARDLAREQKTFVIYQLRKLIADFVRSGVTFGRLDLSNIYLEENVWLQLLIVPDGIVSIGSSSHGGRKRSLSQPPTESATALIRKTIVDTPLMAWSRGQMSNFDYIMALNEMAGAVHPSTAAAYDAQSNFEIGRRLGNPNLHYLMPWVTDFTGDRPESGLRDLRKTKYRLKKGDEQLDMTFQAPVRHHITNIFSDLAYYMYKARQTPVPLLKQYIREKYIPEEYPASMERMFEWTSDECIPEFYTDASLLTSVHSDMSSVALPAWANSPEEFIAKHRELLESELVSRDLHYWIDLTFGCRLTGQLAVEAKNVALPLVSGEGDDMLQQRWGDIRQHGVAQIFVEPHPPRSAEHYETVQNSNQQDAYITNHRSRSPASSVLNFAVTDGSLNLESSTGSMEGVRLGGTVDAADSPRAEDSPNAPALRSSRLTSSLSRRQSRSSTWSGMTLRADPLTDGEGPTAYLYGAIVLHEPLLCDDFFTLELQHLEELCVFSSKYFKPVSIQVDELAVRNPKKSYLKTITEELAEVKQMLVWTLSDFLPAASGMQNIKDADNWLAVLDTIAPDILPQYYHQIHKFILSFYRCDAIEEQFTLSQLVAANLGTLPQEAVHIMAPYFGKLISDRQLTHRLAPLLKHIWLRVGYCGFANMYTKRILNLYEEKPLRDALCDADFLNTLKLVFGKEFVVSRLLAYYVDALSSPLRAGDGATSAESVRNVVTAIRIVTETLGAIQTSKGVLPIVYKTCHKEDVPASISWMCLDAIGDVFGDSFVLSQYPPLISASIRSLTASSLKKNVPVICRIIAVFELTMKKLLLSRAGFNPLEECGGEFTEILTRLLHAPSENRQFSNTDRRWYCESILRSALDTVCHLSQCIAKQDWEQYIVPPLNLYFQGLENVEGFHTDENRSMFETFHSPAMATLVYTRMCQVCGQETMRKHIHRIDLVEQLTYTYIQTQHELSPDAVIQDLTLTTSEQPPAVPFPIAIPTLSMRDLPMSVRSSAPASASSAAPHRRIPSAIKQFRSSSFGLGRSLSEVRSVEAVELDAKWDQHNYIHSAVDDAPLLVYKPRSDLQGNWTKFLSTTGRFHTNTVSFQDLLLYSYSGHPGMQCMTADPHTRLIASGSKDKTVKVRLPSLNVHEYLEQRFKQFSDCSATYHGHQRPVRDVCFLTNHVASCDGSIDIWDAEHTKIVRRVTAPHEFSSVQPLHNTRSLTGSTKHNYI
ncbi:hypothetical protein RI367_001837 [Sorochytrium milnesiophthora]